MAITIQPDFPECDSNQECIMRKESIEKTGQTTKVQTARYCPQCRKYYCRKCEKQWHTSHGMLYIENEQEEYEAKWNKLTEQISKSSRIANRNLEEREELMKYFEGLSASYNRFYLQDKIKLSALQKDVKDHHDRVVSNYIVKYKIAELIDEESNYIKFLKRLEPLQYLVEEVNIDAFWENYAPGLLKVEGYEYMKSLKRETAIEFGKRRQQQLSQQNIGDTNKNPQSENTDGLNLSSLYQVNTSTGEESILQKILTLAGGISGLDMIFQDVQICKIDLEAQKQKQQESDSGIIGLKSIQDKFELEQQAQGTNIAKLKIEFTSSIEESKSTHKSQLEASKEYLLQEIKSATNNLEQKIVSHKAALEEYVAQSKQEKSQQDNRIATLESKISGLETRIQAQDSKIANNESKVSNLTSQIEQLQQAISALKNPA